MFKLIFIGCGGFLGAISRYLISKWVETSFESILPFGTLAVNVLGSFLLGFLMTFFLTKAPVYPELRTAITTGFLGALTTFSTFGYETVMLLEDKNIFFASLNVLSNLIIGLLFITAGIMLARAIS
ncbi:fluoride efflux transporter CrcB [Halanaerobium salsuginis]|jgi:CrcB protein|uniref:Fluoride-specific ion channel FluC n=1 Tax=Halanaerobium salsuginis TaxID=29563 RepID=A0A1I4KAV5_9FIRM|nr:fluoride efflux transporter CrcB [Halanaerobium salsuginis]SFL75820.1 camphor resistance protein CrcB [Halanaerobium salsuginis]